MTEPAAEPACPPGSEKWTFAGLLSLAEAVLPFGRRGVEQSTGRDSVSLSDECLLRVTKDELLRELARIGLDGHPLVRRAVGVAERSHGGQTRDDGSSYLEQHVYPVTVLFTELAVFQKLPVTAESVSLSLLHDALEDDPSLSTQDFGRMFGDRVLSDVLRLTKLPFVFFDGHDEQAKKARRDDFYHRMLGEASVEARLVKLCDRYNNLSCSLRVPNAPKTGRYLVETEDHYLPLARRTSPGMAGLLEEVMTELKTLRRSP